MANALVELLKREQVKLARNVYELAGFYCPMGRMPDVVDFATMQKRTENVTDPSKFAKAMWPQASESFHSKLVSRLTYTQEQLEAVNALKKTCKEGDGLSVEEMFASGLRNSRLYQAKQADTAEAA